jgi:adenosylmethionine-8-amino-7-oxononanoate aminotransferase
VIISREGSYHGTHAYGTSLAGIEANRSGFGELISDVARVPKLSAQALADEIDRAGADRVAAFFAEPMINSGVWAPNDGYLTQVAEICRDRDVLFIADEVVTGFGRLGVNFASERYGIEPDMILFAKGCTSGYLPLGGVIVAKRVRELFWRPDTDVSFRHGYTYSGHATACAAAMANLDILEREELPRRVAEAEADFAAACEVLSDLPEVSEIRAVGFAAAVQLDQAHIERDPDLPRLATAAALEHGVLVRMLSSFSFQISPPLIIDNEEIERIVQGIADGLISLRSDSFRP